MRRRLAQIQLAFTLCGGAVPCTVSADGDAYSWQRSDAPAGIRVFTSEVQRHGYDAVKARLVIAADLRRLFGILQDFEHYTAWYHRTAAVRVLSAPARTTRLQLSADGSLAHPPSGGPWLLYFRQHTPPLDDRWTLLHCSLQAGSNGSLLVAFRSTRRPDIAGPKDAVHMELHGYWELRPLGAARTEVTFMLDVDPNTSVPAFLVDPQLREAAVQTLLSLRDRAMTATSSTGHVR